MHYVTVAILLAIWLGLCDGSVLRNITQNTTTQHRNQTHQQAAKTGKYTYWIDRTCLAIDSDYTNTFFHDSLESMFAMACGAAASLRPNPVVDDDFARVFKMLFNTDVTDKTFYQQSPLWRTRFGTRFNPGLKTPKAMVYDTLNSICNDWYQTVNQASSNLRIYCDHGEIFTDVPGRPLWNAIDGISVTHRCGPTDQDTVAFVGLLAAVGKDWDSQNIDRATMTICDGAVGGGYTIQTLDPKGDLQMSNGKRVTWTHAWPYLLSDALGAKSYGWDACRNLNTEKALINSDCFALAGLAAMLARQRRPDIQTGDVSDPDTFSGGYTIQRTNPAASADLQHQILRSNQRGEIYFYPDISTPGNPHGKNS